MEYLKVKIKELRNTVNFLLHTKNQDVINIDIDTVPDTLQKFPYSDDYWIGTSKINQLTDSTSCLYLGKKGSEFKAHRHRTATEQLVILNKGGEMRIITPYDDILLKFPNAFLIDANVPHLVIFNEDTTVLCIWNPPFAKGWEAEAIKNLKS